MSRVLKSEGKALAFGGSFAVAYHSKVEMGYEFITGLPMSSQRHDCIMVIVDKLSKVAHFSPMRASYTASSVAHVFLEDIVRLHGIPH